MSAAKKVAAEEGSTKKRPPELHAELPKPDDLEQSKSPYPKEVQFFSYQPKDGSEPILLALNGFEAPDKLWLFDISQLPWLTQTWRWMTRANIPKSIQRQAQKLSDEEYFKMFDEWFDVMRKLNDAGPKGVVTSGK
jgi:hypothetical protein